MYYTIVNLDNKTFYFSPLNLFTMGLPFNSKAFKAAVENCKKQFSSVALAIYVKDMIDDYEMLLKESIKKSKAIDSGKEYIIKIPMGTILEKHQKKFSLSELPESITDGSKKYPVRENVYLYFNEIAELEDLLAKK